MRRWRRVGVALLFGAAACAPDARTDTTPTPTRETEVLVAADDSTWLAGTLTRPVAHVVGGRLAAVLLISGSGPQDRDGSRLELPGYAPWRDVSEALVAQGMAVLRLDDRGTGRSTGRFAGATTDDFARDAAAAVAWLRRQPDIDSLRVGLVGHSEGAVVALLVARADSAERALVLLGAPSRSGREIARWQRQELVTGDLARWPVEAQRSVLAAADSAAESAAVHDAWLRRWFALDPREVAAGVRQPVLLVHGDTDRQVPPSHADELAAVLRQAGAQPVQVQHLRDTDHLLLADVDGDPQGYVRLTERRVRASAISATTHFLSIHMASR